mmetsp:Transcript_7707/g.8905  ORF Transcript_7707/g.8905 Transcript_7707/m.8905 type:complete len:269 (-) Transcript_7707:233-1039(-)|eukprot:CAMPEP_0204612136 /NCGR_PEP_ID=MMETSP0717-20131115/237_1 /ASSEMBLY_ACC=CAM_ASM_000666 /TAXON_ID=230516 /ORGANISM="Chaetoceros curvisetus" /LENGTH=268 /DNA_ID=CAMNT_0051624089 /DNA_START=187 /DNA_END=993 /DNA_ORIENTATION=-
MNATLMDQVNNIKLPIVDIDTNVIDMLARSGDKKKEFQKEEQCQETHITQKEATTTNTTSDHQATTNIPSLPLPDLIPIHQNQTCDACPYCNDICLEWESCEACLQKIKDLNITYHLPRLNKKIRRRGRGRGRVKTQDDDRDDGSEGSSSCGLWFQQKQKQEKETYISSCHLRRHNTKESAWLKCGNVIYDATTFVRGHPGGENCILKKSGGRCDDCTRDMMFHSPKAISLWKSQRVGVYRPCCGPGCHKDNLDESSSHSDNESCVIS